MSYSYSQKIFNHRIRKINTLKTIMSRHANVATRDTRDSWHLIWYADRIEIVFAHEGDWAFFSETFLDRHEWTLATQDLVPNAKEISERCGREWEARYGEWQAQMVLDGISAHLSRNR